MRNIFWLVCAMLLLSTLSASAYVQGEIQDMRCINKTAFAFIFSNKGMDDLNTADINVKVEIEGLAYSPPEETKAPFTSGYTLPLTGTWDKPIIPGKNAFETSSAVYQSQSGLLFYPAQYRITIGYPNCDPSLCRMTTVKCKPTNYCEISQPVRCDGVTKFGCDATKLEIIHCRNMKDKLELKFKGLDSHLMMDIKPYTGVEYAFYGSTIHIENDLPEDTVIEEVEKDTYLLTFSLYNNNKVDRVRIKDRLICDHEDYANCKSWYISEETPVISAGQEQETAEDKSIASETTTTITSIMVYMIVIIIVGIAILKRRKRRI